MISDFYGASKGGVGISAAVSSTYYSWPNLGSLGRTYGAPDDYQLWSVWSPVAFRIAQVGTGVTLSTAIIDLGSAVPASIPYPLLIESPADAQIGWVALSGSDSDTIYFSLTSVKHNGSTSNPSATTVT